MVAQKPGVRSGRFLAVLSVVIWTTAAWSTASGVTTITDDFSGPAGAPIDLAKWTPYTDTTPASQGWGPPGGSVSLNGAGQAVIAPSTSWSGGGFFSNATFPNSGTFRIQATMQFDRGNPSQLANNLAVYIRNADPSWGRNPAYLSFAGPQVRFDILPPWPNGTTLGSSVYIQPFAPLLGGGPMTLGSPSPTWTGTPNNVVFDITYNADDGSTTYRVLDPTTLAVLSEAQGTIDSSYRLAMGSSLCIEVGIDGYQIPNRLCDFIMIEYTPIPEPVSLVSVMGGLACVGGYLRRRCACR